MYRSIAPSAVRPAVAVLAVVLPPAARMLGRSAIALAAVGLVTGPLGRGLRRPRP
ncbi:hypothetical protein [Alienimonas californiensis]|uniref:Uncharacterized protein n=1 Tax=Alienimonas californiensis TaxID=2527989 RepID=A0A517P6S5_9PLAN|nr:hypothetical protein [Alienimonas californiensis]QDT15074.1 hypothetical protein CA12_11540 [Alienimonas californiensis]